MNIVPPRPTSLPVPVGELWVFAYGSLMWNPGFPYLRRERAMVHGFHRSLCVRSCNYRGTPTTPGLVVGLDEGGSCIGYAFLADRAEQDVILDYLEQREMLDGVYRPALVELEIEKGTIEALTFIANRQSPSYAGGLSEAEIIATVAAAEGDRGPNSEYVINTAHCLKELGLSDPLIAVAEHLHAGSGHRANTCQNVASLSASAPNTL
ncbi:gamma-glutamylcyclotransferase [Gammaproteobacteria bacterium]|nr:gamma-glutamylcyclotransferase [Gammaproteobacteria bacterium]